MAPMLPESLRSIRWENFYEPPRLMLLDFRKWTVYVTDQGKLTSRPYWVRSVDWIIISPAILHTRAGRMVRGYSPLYPCPAFAISGYRFTRWKKEKTFPFFWRIFW